MRYFKIVEAAVDLFTTFLFQRLGFYDEKILFAFPQFPHYIYFSNNESYAATPDFTVMDILSFSRIAVAEDKSEKSSSDKNTEGQLIAEAIAIHQSNCKGDSSNTNIKVDHILGLKVKGMEFTIISH
eukprot:gene4422-6251_t